MKCFSIKYKLLLTFAILLVIITLCNVVLMSYVINRCLHRADELEGTGIGLVNVRRIIVRYDGRTWAEGKVDQGATLYCSRPRSIQGAYTC